MAISIPLPATDEIITQIYRGILEATPWQCFLRCLRVRMDCDVAAIMLRPGEGGIESNLWEGGPSFNTEDLQRIYSAHARLKHLDPMINALRNPGDIIILDDIISREELSTNQFYLEVLKPNGNEFQLGMCFAEPSGWRCWVGLMNGAAKGNFGDAEKLFFREFRGHLEMALQIYASLQRNEAEKEIYGEALDRLTIGAIILNARGELVEANHFGRTLLHGGALISLQHGRLVLPEKADTEALYQLIAEASLFRQKSPNETFAEVMRVKLPSSRKEFGLLLRAAPHTRGFQSDANPSVIVYFGDPDQQSLAPEQAVAQLFGLKPWEAKLATLLANGCTLVEAAAQLNVTENSIRTYSKRIYAKTGVKGQTDLVRLILKSVALLGG